MVDNTRTVYFTEPAKRASTMALDEVNRLHHAYRGPEHYLLGLLRHGDNPAARVLVAHGLDLETARAEVDRLIAQGVLPGPPSDAELRQQGELQARWLDAQNLPPENRAEVERLIAQGVIPPPDLGDAPLLATLGIDLEAVAGRLRETFGHQADWRATERVWTRPSQGATHRPMGVPPPFVCVRFMDFRPPGGGRTRPGDRPRAPAAGAAAGRGLPGPGASPGSASRCSLWDRVQRERRNGTAGYARPGATHCHYWRWPSRALCHRSSSQETQYRSDH